MTFGLWRQKARLLDSIRLLTERGSVTDAALDSRVSSVSAYIAAFEEHGSAARLARCWRSAADSTRPLLVLSGERLVERLESAARRARANEGRQRPRRAALDDASHRRRLGPYEPRSFKSR